MSMKLSKANRWLTHRLLAQLGCRTGVLHCLWQRNRVAQCELSLDVCENLQGRPLAHSQIAGIVGVLHCLRGGEMGLTLWSGAARLRTFWGQSAVPIALANAHHHEYQCARLPAVQPQQQQQAGK
jgi:hypothetical protein